MPAYVSFLTPAIAVGKHDGAVAGVGRARVTEELALDDSTEAVVEMGEFLQITSTEGSAIRFAWGTNPDASRTTENVNGSGELISSAGVPLGAGATSAPIVAAPGSKVNVKAP